MRRDLHTSIKKAARVLSALPASSRVPTSLLLRRVGNSTTGPRHASLLLARLGIDPKTAVSLGATRRQAAKTSIGGIPHSLSPSHRQAQLQRMRSSIQQRQQEQRRQQLLLQQQQQQQQDQQQQQKQQIAHSSSQPRSRFVAPSKTERAAQNAMAIQQAIRMSSPFYSQPEQQQQQQQQSSFWSNLRSLFSRAQPEHRIQHHHYHHHFSSTDTSAFTNYPPVSTLIMEAETALPPIPTASNETSPDSAEPVSTHLPPPFFESLPLILPPNYPPPTPRIPDMDIRATALGVNHLAGSDIGPDAAWILERPSRLEYLGDSVLELATRSLLFKELTDLSPHSMGILKAHLVSNDVLGHLYNQAGLETLRIDTAEWAIETLRTQHPSSIIGGKSLVAELDGGKYAISVHQDHKLQAAKRWLSFGAPEDKTSAFAPSSLYTAQQAPPSSISSGAIEGEEAQDGKRTARRRRISQYLSDLPHSRKADLFEAYLGALYLSLSPSVAAEWVQALLRPFAARAMRHERMQAEEALTRAGLVRRRAKQKKAAQLENEKLLAVKEYEEQARREMAGSDLVEAEPALVASAASLANPSSTRSAAPHRLQHQPRWNVTGNNTNPPQSLRQADPSPSPTWWQRMFRP